VRRRPRRVGARGGTSGHARPCRGAAMPRSQSRLCWGSSSSNAREGGTAHRGSGGPGPWSARARGSARSWQRCSRSRAHAWGARAPYDGPDEAQAGPPRAGAHPFRERAVPVLPRRLEPLQRPAGVLDAGGAMPRRGTPHAARLLGPAGRGPQAAALQPRTPLTGVDSGLGAVGRTLPLAGGDPPPLEAGACEPVRERAPVHARRGHGHRRPLALPPPGSAGRHVGCEGAESRRREEAGPRGRWGRRGAETRGLQGAHSPLTQWRR
jgi:hypothetical protein